jgi:hypothetical protein
VSGCEKISEEIFTAIENGFEQNFTLKELHMLENKQDSSQGDNEHYNKLTNLIKEKTNFLKKR